METARAILVIDDSEADRLSYQRYLSQDPKQVYIFSEADCAQSGLDLCRQQAFDVILLDFLLPDMSGLEVLPLLKAQYPDIDINMLTGYGDESVAVSALKGGAQDYLVKEHLTQTTLRRSVRTVLAQRQLRHRLQKTQQQQQLITQLAFQIRHSLELTKTLESVVIGVRRLLQCDRVLAYQFAADMSGQIIAESVGDSWRVTLGQVVELDSAKFFLQCDLRSSVAGYAIAKSNEHSHTQKARNVRDWLNHHKQPVQLWNSTPALSKSCLSYAPASAETSRLNGLCC